MLKFLYIHDDPFTNNTQEFVRILAISVTPPGGEATSFAGTLIDPQGIIVANFTSWLQNVGNSGLTNPYSTSGGIQADSIIIIPPGWVFRGFYKAIAVQGSLEEVLRVH